jgi:hypothetical protein
MTMKFRVGLQRELVARQVRRAERQRLLDVGERLIQRPAPAGPYIRSRLTSSNSSTAGRGGRARLRRIVHAAERLQVARIEALHADRQPRDAGVAVALEAPALERAGVRPPS